MKNCDISKTSKTSESSDDSASVAVIQCVKGMSEKVVVLDNDIMACVQNGNIHMYIHLYICTAFNV